MSEPKGVACECGRFTPFTAYVYAHMRDVLSFRCECGREYAVVAGTAALRLDLPPSATPRRRRKGALSAARQGR